MKDHKDLLEAYDDALFALLMENVTKQEGKRLLEENRRLREDPASAVPEATIRRGIRAIDHALLRRDLAVFGRGAMKVVNHAAMFVLIVTAFIVTAFAASPQFRADTMNFLLEITERGTSIIFPDTGSGSGSSTSSDELPFTVGWMPEGYTLVESVRNGPTAWAVYKNSEGTAIQIDLVLLTGGSLLLDTEDADVVYTEVNELQAMVISKGNKILIAIIDESREIVLTVDARDVAKTDLLHVAEEIVF